MRRRRNFAPRFETMDSRLAPSGALPMNAPHSPPNIVASNDPSTTTNPFYDDSNESTMFADLDNPFCDPND